MQVYKPVPTLTARPKSFEIEEINHRLYGFLETKENCSVMKWTDLAVEEIKTAWEDKKVPVIVGGTGLYIQTLMKGLSPLPDVPEEVRQKVRKRYEEKGHEFFLCEYLEKDSIFRFSDPQRLLRAAEIWEVSGKSITYWQSLEPEKRIEAKWLTVLLDLPREVLYERCNKRFEEMIQENAIEEVKQLLAENPSEDSFIMKAIGVREIRDFLSGKISKAQAISQAQQLTRNYAKRQMTWFRHRMKPDVRIINSEIEPLLTKVLHFLA